MIYVSIAAKELHVGLHANRNNKTQVYAMIIRDTMKRLSNFKRNNNTRAYRPVVFFESTKSESNNAAIIIIQEHLLMEIKFQHKSNNEVSNIEK